MSAPDGTVFRDLNGNGVLDPYEDPRLDVATRVDDLLARMTLDEKVGQMFHDLIEAGPEGELVEHGAHIMAESTTDVLSRRHMTHFNLLQLPRAEVGAAWHNRLQRAAEDTRLGIPITISTDPRHSVAENFAASLHAGSFSIWPEAIGLAALADPEAVLEFARIARREYLAVGIRAALHPQVDLATEPRWARQSTTFGPDAILSSAYVRAYLEGFQDGWSVGPTSVACMTKHFPGGGPQKDGEDPHFPYGREQVYPSGNFEYHLEPFRAAIDAGTSAIMPYYGMPVGLRYRGRAIEEVGFGYNRQVIEGILREELGFDGVVCTDWQLVSDFWIQGRHIEPRAWGVEHLDRHSRVEKILDAGCDQLGGERCTEVLLDLVHAGRITQERIDQSVRRLLRVKFELGLFDDPYVDEDVVNDVVGHPDAVARGLDAQVRSTVVLQRGPALDRLEQAPATFRVYPENMDPAAFAGLVEVAETPEQADVAVIRLGSAFEPRDTLPIESAFHAGSLEYSAGDVARVARLARQCPVIVDVTLDRPAIVTALEAVADSVVGSFVITDRALAHVIARPARATGKLPFDLPRDSVSVDANLADAPFDLQQPLHRHARWPVPAASSTAATSLPAGT